MKKIRDDIKDKVAILIFWLISLAILYIVLLKIKYLFH